MDCNLDFFLFAWRAKMSVKKSARDIFMKDDGGGPSNIILAGQSFFCVLANYFLIKAKQRW